MLEYILTYFCSPKLSRWRIFMILSSSLLLIMYYKSNKRISLSVDSPKPQKRKRKMINKVYQLFKDLEDYAKNGQILIKNEGHCKEKIFKMIDDGLDLLQIISDFDRTISKYMSKSRPNLTCHGVFEADPELSEEVKNQMTFLRDKYYPIEINNSMSNSEKIPFMIEWWTKAHDLLIDLRLHRDVLENTIRDHEIELRTGFDDFLRLTSIKNVPLLIFSAGVGNVIEEILRQKHLLLDNVRIVSNFMNFNNEGILTGFQDEIIHSFNKSAKSIQDSEYYENICTKRKNIILIGDSTGDPQMSEGFPDDINVLKIGFLNNNVDDLKEKYMDIYDIVVVTDETFSVPKLIFDSILIS